MNVQDPEKQQELKIDNIYDLLFDAMGQPKEEHMQEKLVFTG